MPGVRVRCGLGVTGTQTLILLLTYLESLLSIAGPARLVRQLVLLCCLAPLPSPPHRPGAVHQILAIDCRGSFIRWTQVRASWS